MAYLTKQQAAARLGIGIRTLDGLIRSGKLPAYRVAERLVRIDEADLERYAKSQRVPAEPKAKTAAPTVRRPCLYVPGQKVV